MNSSNSFEGIESVYLAGRYGMVGRALERRLTNRGVECLGESSSVLDFTSREAVFHEFARIRPRNLIISAAKVGGIFANAESPVDFLSINLQIQTNLMDAAHANGIERVLFLGSSCIYPKFATQPISESELLRGPLEETNEAYAIAKIAGVKLIQAYQKQYGARWISAMPTNLYGPYDNFDPITSHVIPALIYKISVAKQNGFPSVTLWGDGSPLREFMHVDDLADACVFLLSSYDEATPINVGSGYETSIRNLAETIKSVIGYEGEIKYDHSKPNGTPRKLLNSQKLQELGWTASISLNEGIKRTYEWYQKYRLEDKT